MRNGCPIGDDPDRVPDTGDFLIDNRSGLPVLVFDSEGDFVDIGLGWVCWRMIRDDYDFGRGLVPPVVISDYRANMDAARRQRFEACARRKKGEVMQRPQEAEQSQCEP